jgi:hypothetical protein
MNTTWLLNEQAYTMDGLKGDGIRLATNLTKSIFEKKGCRLIESASLSSAPSRFAGSLCNSYTINQPTNPIIL